MFWQMTLLVIGAAMVGCTGGIVAACARSHSVHLCRGLFFSGLGLSLIPALFGGILELEWMACAGWGLVIGGLLGFSVMAVCIVGTGKLTPPPFPDKSRKKGLR